MALFRDLQQSPKSYWYAGTFRTPSQAPSPIPPMLFFFAEYNPLAEFNPFTAK